MPHLFEEIEVDGERHIVVEISSGQARTEPLIRWLENHITLGSKTLGEFLEEKGLKLEEKDD